MSMTLEERGLYRETLDRCWEAGSLPVDESLLRKMCGVSAWEWKRSWPRVKAQFVEVDGRYHHPKVDEKRPDLQSWHEGRKEAGKRGAEKRWGKKSDSSANSSAIATEWPSSSSTTSTTREEPPKPPTADSAIDSCSPGGERDTEPQLELIPATGAPPTNGTLKQHQGEWFREWWKIYWRKESRKSAERAFQKHVRSPDRFGEIMAATSRQTPSMVARETEHQPLGATWLNGERWTDAPHLPARASPGRQSVTERTEALWAERIAKGERPI